MPAFVVGDSTQKILKNFSNINGSLLLRDGKKQKTMLASKAVLAIADLPDAWPKETGVYDLNMFLGVLSSFPRPGIQFNDDAMIIVDDTKGSKLSIKYRYSDPSTILATPNKDLPSNNPDVEFTLSETVLAQVKKTASTLKLASVTLHIDKSDVSITAQDPKAEKTSHALKLDIASEDVQSHKSLQRTMTFKGEHLGLLVDGTYNVSVASGWKYAFFSNKSLPISYYIVEQTKD